MLSRQRPMVNGHIVPFHVRDLPHLARAPPTRKNHVNVQAPRSYDTDLVVVLDMDECLIHTQFFDEPSKAAVYAHQVQNTSSQSSADTKTEPVESFRLQLEGDGTLAHVHMRPGLMEFLEHITATYETHIFTAATSIYANPVLDQLCTRLGSSGSDVFTGRWFREHCVWNEQKGAFVKDLSRLPVSLEKTVLVDNQPLSFLAQPDNGILVNAFFTDGSDETLPAVSRFISEELQHADDVRTILNDRFQLSKLLKQIEDESNPAVPGQTPQKARPHRAML